MSEKEMKDLMSETIVIATLIQHPEFSFHAPELKHKDFYESANQVLYWAICNLVKKDIPIDVTNLIAQINSNERTFALKAQITEPDIRELVELSYDSEMTRQTVEEYLLPVKNIRDWAFRRKMSSTLKKGINFCYQYDGSDIRADIYNMIQGVMDEFSTVDQAPLLGDLIDDIWEEIEAVDEKRDCVDFPIPQLNEFCQMERKETIVFAAQQKRGKSILCMNSAVQLLKEGKGVLYIDTEISTKQFSLRLLAHLSQIEYRRIKKQQLNDAERSALAKWRAWIKQQKIIHVYSPYTDKTELINLVYSYKNKYQIDAVIFDYVKGSGSTDDAFAKSQKLGEIVDTLKNTIAGKMDLITVCAAQATPDGGIADSRKIARNCSTLVILERKNNKQIVEDGGLKYGDCYLSVRDNRNGALHSENEYISIDFDGDRCTFKECKQPIRDGEKPY